MLLTGAALTQEQVRERVTPSSAQEMLSPALAAFIAQSRDAAIARGVRSVAPNVREAFAGFVSDEVLELSLIHI